MFSNILRSFLRQIVRNKVFLLLNVTGLALGIATCLVIAIWAQRELSFDNFHPNADNKYRLWNTFKSEAETFSQASSAVALGAHLPKEMSDVVSACRVFKSGYKVRSADEVHFEDNVIIADSSFFDFFGFEIIRGGNTELLSKPDAVVLTQRMAIKYFGSADAALGQTLYMDDNAVTIEAIADDPPQNSHIEFDIAVPYKALHSYAMTTWKEDLDNLWVGGWPYVYVELADAGRHHEVESQINTLIAERAKKEWEENNMSYQYFLQPLKSIHLHSDLRYDAANNGSIVTVRIFIAVAMLVLLLACFNYINLTTAASVKRAKEISVRKVVGANKAQLVRQFLLETFVTTSVAVAIGLAIAQTLMPYFSYWMGQQYGSTFTPSNVLLLAGFVVIVTLLSGAYPAIVLSSFQPIVTLRGKFFGSDKGQSFRKALVVLQFTISTVLLISILTVQRQMNFIGQKHLGYDEEGVIAVNFNGDDAVQKRYDEISVALRSVPYIESTTLHASNVVGGLGNGWINTIDSEGKEISTSIYRMSVDPDYFEAYRMKIVAGRPFMRGTSDSSKAVLVNEAAVKNLGWKSADDALGKPFGSGDNARFVVGVVADFHFENLHQAVQPLLIGYANGGGTISLRVSTAHISEALDHLETVWAKAVPGVPLSYSFIDESLEAQYAKEKKMETIFYLFAGLSFFIACLGLFGLSMFMVRQRLQEISIRKVFGAPVTRIIVLLTKDFSKLVLISVVIAAPIGWLLMDEWLSTFTYRTTIGWIVIAIAIITPLLISLITVSTQAVKAALVNPAKVLRSE